VPSFGLSAHFDQASGILSSINKLPPPSDDALSIVTVISV